MMTDKVLVGVALSVSIFFYSNISSAQDLIDAQDPSEIQNLASGYGSARLTTDSVGDPLVRGRMDGKAYLIYFYGCTEGKNCRSISFATYWIGTQGVTREKIEEWNQSNRFGYAYLDSDGDPRLDMDVNLFGGVSGKNLDDTIDWWRVMMKKFDGYIK